MLESPRLLVEREVSVATIWGNVQQQPEQDKVVQADGMCFRGTVLDDGASKR